MKFAVLSLFLSQSGEIVQTSCTLVPVTANLNPEHTAQSCQPFPVMNDNSPQQCSFTTQLILTVGRLARTIKLTACTPHPPTGPLRDAMATQHKLHARQNIVVLTVPQQLDVMLQNRWQRTA